MTKAVRFARHVPFTRSRMRIITSILGIVALPLVSAHKEADTLPDPLIPIYAASILTILIIIYSISRNVDALSSREKLVCFWLIALPVMLASLYLVIHTLYDTTNSETKGPIHWHADYQIWTCGEKLDLTNPRFPKNKIGSPLLHEHNDDRIHVEGTVSYLETITLGRFFGIIGGALSEDTISYPTTKGIKTFTNGDTCLSGAQGTLKVYVNGKSIADPASYLLYPASLVPPGDCIIVQFDEIESETTDKQCASWEVKRVTYGNLTRPSVNIGGRSW